MLAQSHHAQAEVVAAATRHKLGSRSTRLLTSARRRIQCPATNSQLEARRIHRLFTILP
jgi:hypothetical protein